MDQFASKVVEKCLKIGGAEFLERYLERVCEGRADRPRIPLIDSRMTFMICGSNAYFAFSCKRPVRELSDPIYSHSCQCQSSRCCCLAHSVRLAFLKHTDMILTVCSKHMVSLRGSKFGSRVGMLCCNPAYATHPGPGVGLPANRFSSGHNNTRFGGAYR